MGMATVLAREYPKTWLRVLAYGAAGTVTVSRFMAHDPGLPICWLGLFSALRSGRTSSTHIAIQS
jgi:hypothetical protein